MSKPKIIKDYVKLDKATIEQIKLTYPYGFEENLIVFVNREGKNVTALPFETDDRYYLIRMTDEEAIAIIEDDDDYDKDGNLDAEIKAVYEEKHEELVKEEE